MTVVLLWAAPDAAAQGPIEPWAAEIEEPLRSAYPNRLVQLIVQWFGLSEEQEIVLSTLHEAHQEKFARFRDAHAPLRDEYDAKWRNLPPASLERHVLVLEREEALAAVADQQADLDDQFLLDIQSVLTDEQVARWEMFIEWLHRHRWLASRRQYLEQPIDLIALLDELEKSLPEAGEAVPSEVVRAYSRQMDQALLSLVSFEIEFARTRNRAEEDRVRTDGERIWLDADVHDPRDIYRWFEERHEVNRRIRDINQQFRAAFQAHLPPNAARHWARLFRARIADLSGADIAGAGPGRLMDDLREHVPDLSDDQRASLDAALDAYERGCDLRVRRILDASDSVADMSYERIEISRRQSRNRMSPDEYSNAQRAWEERMAAQQAEYEKALVDFKEHEHRAIQQMLAVLTHEQQAIITAHNTTDDGTSVPD